MKNFLTLLFALLLVVSLVACSGNGGAETDVSTETGGTDTTVTTPYDGPEFFVSTEGSANGNGSEAAPFATLEAAVARIHELREAGNDTQFTVSIFPGEYAIETVNFDKIDGGTAEAPTIIRGIGDGDTVLNAGKYFPFSSFKPVEDEEMKARFYPEVADKILVCDLAAEGVTADMIGIELGFGASSTMPSELKGTNIGFYWDNTRLTNARYPNDSGKYLYEDQAHIEEGGVVDGGTSTSGGTLKVSGELADHLAKWKTVEGAMCHAYFKFNWAEETTTIANYDAEKCELTFTYPASNGAETGYREGAEYYLYNVPEELDAPGEYYLDRENLKLYILPVDDSETPVTMSYRRAPMITGEICYVTFENLTMECVCSDVIAPSVAEGMTVKNCVVRNFEGNGIKPTTAPYNNTVSGCEVYNCGFGGIFLNDGGDYETLTHANNLVENCKVYNIGQINRCYTGAIGVNGVGATISHNEIYNAPHAVLSAGGLENTIEWNYVHDVTQESDDAGAFYGGGQWHSFGNVISHNKFERIGNEVHSPNGIYFDDMLSGWTAQYNVLIDVYGYGFMVGGGRNITITNNLIINHGQGGYIYYDQRMRDHYLEGHPSFVNQDTGMWAELNKYRAWSLTETWASKYPDLAAITYDTSDIDDPNFPINPANSVIKNNIYIGAEMTKWNNIFWDTVKQYSEIGEYVYNSDAARIFEEGTYEFNKVGKRSKIDYETIPYDGYGVVED